MVSLTSTDDQSRRLIVLRATSTVVVSLYCGLIVLGLGGRLAQTDREQRALPESERGIRAMRGMRGLSSMPPPPLLTQCRASCSLVPETEAGLKGVWYGKQERRLGYHRPEAYEEAGETPLLPPGSYHRPEASEASRTTSPL